MQKKVCRRGLNDIWINECDGKVRICGWSNFYIGSLVENSIEEIWNGERAQLFRESMLDGSYRYCNHSKCPYCANDGLEELMVEYDVPKLPSFCSLSYQLQCNYACKFCRADHYKICDGERENYYKIENEIKKMLPGLKTLSTNGAGEFFCSDSIIRLIQTETLNKQTRIEIETNGSLFIEENWDKIKKLGEHDLRVAVTVHSFDDSTYKYLSGTELSVNRVMENLEYISQLRDAGKINELEIATVVCERNFRELPRFVETCLEKYSMDTIRIRFFEPYGVMDPLTEWFYDVRNEYHPYHEEFVAIMNHPILNHPKVWKWQGETKSLQQESPYVLEKRTSNAFAELVQICGKNRRVQSYFEKNNYSKIALYGASSIGIACKTILNKEGIKVDTIFDTYATVFDKGEGRILKPDENNTNLYDLIIITTDTFVTQITENLERAKYKGCVKTLSSLVSELGEE